MDFDLTKEQEMIRKEVRKFAQSEIAPIAAELDEQEAFSNDLTLKMGEIGLFGMFVSEAYEGQGMDYLSYIIAVEEVARVDGSQAATVAAGNSAVSSISAAMGATLSRAKLRARSRIIFWFSVSSIASSAVKAFVKLTRPVADGLSCVRRRTSGTP